MGESTALHKEQRVAETVKKGFTDLCYDGKPFYSKAHKVGETTYSNLSDAKLSADSFIAARTTMMSLKNDQGQPLNLVPDTLLVPPALEQEARMILEADLINGTTNINKGLAKVDVYKRQELKWKPLDPGKKSVAGGTGTGGRICLF